MADQTYYKSAYTGEQIDDSLGRIISGEIDQAVSDAQKSAQDAAASADAAEAVAVRTPYVGANGNWMVWDLAARVFIDSGVPARGATGATGPQGAKGETGPRGPEGKQGPQGIQGLTGATGPQGERGPVGATGPQGQKGETGDVGPQGVPGPQGPAGPKGTDGVLTELGTGVFAMGISEDGHLLVSVNETEAAPPLEIDPETGHLLYKIN